MLKVPDHMESPPPNPAVAWLESLSSAVMQFEITTDVILTTVASSLIKKPAAPIEKDGQPAAPGAGEAAPVVNAPAASAPAVSMKEPITVTTPPIEAPRPKVEVKAAPASDANPAEAPAAPAPVKP